MYMALWLAEEVCFEVYPSTYLVCFMFGHFSDFYLNICHEYKKKKLADNGRCRTAKIFWLAIFSYTSEHKKLRSLTAGIFIGAKFCRALRRLICNTFHASLEKLRIRQMNKLSEIPPFV